MKAVLISLLVTQLLALLGCSASFEPRQSEADGAALLHHPDPILSEIPLPNKQDIQRDISDITEWVAWGTSTGLKGGTYSADGNSLVLTATPGELSFAIYELYAGSFDFDTVFFEITDVVNPDSLWYGISDYSGERWRWTPYTPGADSIDVSGFDAKGEGGAAYLAVAVYDGGVARMVKSWIELDKPAWTTAPVALNAGMGQVNGMAMVAGWPSIAAIDQVATDEFNIHYFRATVNHPAGPSDWSESLVITGFNDSPAALEMAGDEGFLPNIALIDDGGGLYYGYSASSAPTGESDWSWCGISSARDSELGFALVSGKPAMLYNDYSVDGGDALVYVRANKDYPAIWSDWDSLLVASTSSASQEYSGLSLASVNGLIPGMQYWDGLVNEHRYASSEWAMPANPGLLSNTAIHVPSLGGVWSSTASWYGNPVLFYDSVNSSSPRFALGTFLPTAPDDFDYYHRILDRGCEEIVAFADDNWVGAAWRDLETRGIMFAMYDYIPQFGPDSGGDWKVWLVDARNTAGEIGLIDLDGGVPSICYHATADGLMYFAWMEPPT